MRFCSCTKKYIIVKSLFFLLLCSAVTAIPCSAALQSAGGTNEIPGLFDFSNIDYAYKPVSNLRGTWEFYWEKLLTPENFSSRFFSPDLYVKIPGSWITSSINGKNLGKYGYATYRVRVRLPKTDQPLGLRIPVMFSASKIYFNGRMLASTGIVSDSEKSVNPAIRTIMMPLPVDLLRFDSDNEIIVQVANFVYHHPGPFANFEIGVYQEIVQRHEKGLSRELFVFGALVLMGLYHLAIYFIRRKDRSPLYFGLLCFSAAVFPTILGETNIVLWNNLDGKLLWFIFFFTWYFSVLMLMLYVKEIYPEQHIPRVSKFFITLSAIATLLIVLAPLKVYLNNTFVLPIQLMQVAMMIYVIIIVIRGIRAKVSGSIVYLVCLMILFFTVINDMLHSEQVIESFYLAGWGLFIFIGAQAFQLAHRFMVAFRDVEIYSSELFALKSGLEEQVRSRTSELNNALNDIAQNHDQLQQAMEELEAVNDNLTESNLELETAQKKAEEGTLAKSRFLANMSHEIRTPMNAIMGMINLSLISDKESKKKEYLLIAKDSADHLLTVINDILDFSKIEAEKLILWIEDFDAHLLIRNTLKTMSFSALEKNLTLGYVLESVPQYLKGDSSRIRQILINLISNALKFTEEGSVTVTVKAVKIDTDTAGVMYSITFSVIDTGPGIKDTDLELIFESFTQTEETLVKRYKGTGLGLAITKQLVNLMNGEMKVSSVFGEGSTFTFTLPLAPGKEPDIIQQPSVSSEQNLKSKHLKFLVAEDNRANQILIKHYLHLLGHTLHVAEDGNAVLEILKQNSFDIVIMDVEMPEMNGFEAAQKIRDGYCGEQRRTIPIIAMTAHVISDFREISAKTGINDFITKPVSLKELDTILEKYK